MCSEDMDKMQTEMHTSYKKLFKEALSGLRQFLAAKAL